MFNYYIYRTYFNAKHSFNGDITKIHGHSFTVVTYIGMKDSKEDIPFFKLEAIISMVALLFMKFTKLGGVFIPFSFRERSGRSEALFTSSVARIS